VEEAPIRRALLLENGIEIGGGLGPLAGKVWRIGLMGESARQESVLAVLAALEQQLRKAGRPVRIGAATTAALEAYAAAG
jgi:alanine-glyoxylate transaminase/serine-glyoxylate transaminase/serine-pyruvate transaminase